MDSRAKPWFAIAGVAMTAFIIWLAIQMSRTDEADRRLLALAIGGALAAGAMVIGIVARRRRDR